MNEKQDEQHTYIMKTADETVVAKATQHEEVMSEVVGDNTMTLRLYDGDRHVGTIPNVKYWRIDDD